MWNVKSCIILVFFFWSNLYLLQRRMQNLAKHKDQERAEQVWWVEVIFINLSIFWQNVSVKLSNPMLSVNLEYFIIKKRNAEFFQYPAPQKLKFYRQWRLLKKLYKICTDDYDNNEYLAVKYVRFFTRNIIGCL